MPERNDDRTRPTKPPEEDSPPGQYRQITRRSLPEPIAKVALRAPLQPTLEPHEELLQAIALTERKQAERQKIFEEHFRQELKDLVIREVKSIPPPPPRPEEKKRFEWPHLQYVAAFIVALTGLIALILNAQKPPAEVLKRFEAVDSRLDSIGKKLDTHVDDETKQRTLDREQDYKYALDVRSWVTDVLERAASVKIDDPPGTPKRDQLGFYPPPRIDPHRVTDTHIVQPRDPYPVPPPP